MLENKDNYPGGNHSYNGNPPSITDVIEAEDGILESSNNTKISTAFLAGSEDSCSSLNNFIRKVNLDVGVPINDGITSIRTTQDPIPNSERALASVNLTRNDVAIGERAPFEGNFITDDFEMASGISSIPFSQNSVADSERASTKVDLTRDENVSEERVSSGRVLTKSQKKRLRAKASRARRALDKSGADEDLVCSEASKRMRSFESNSPNSLSLGESPIFSDGNQQKKIKTSGSGENSQRIEILQHMVIKGAGNSHLPNVNDNNSKRTFAEAGCSIKKVARVVSGADYTRVPPPSNLGNTTSNAMTNDDVEMTLATHSYSDVARASLTIIIGKVGEDRKMNEAELEHCQDHLWKLSSDLDASLHAESSAVEDGTLVVKCSTQAFYEWMKQTVCKIPSLGNTKFAWYSGTSEPKLKKAFCIIPGKLRNTLEVLRRIGTQNEGLDTKKWRVYSHQKAKDLDGSRLVVGIDPASVKVLQSRYNWRPYLALGRIKFVLDSRKR